MNRQERERYLEERGLLPPLYRQLEIRASALRVARTALRLSGEERRRNEALESKFRVLAIKARAGERIQWPHDE